MNKSILYLAILLASFTSCDASDDDTYSQVNQISRIKSFVEDQYLDYTVINNAIYVANIDDVVMVGEKIETGDSVYLYYAIFEFYSSIDDLVYTNMESMADDYNFYIDDASYEPLKIKYGTTDLYEGMNLALSGLVKEGTYIAFIPSSYVYGDRYNGVVTDNTSLAIYMYVENIIKN
ncbi:MAG: hypothetical protein R3Y51_07825 [Rikenellaceae bacterium]